MHRFFLYHSAHLRAAEYGAECLAVTLKSVMLVQVTSYLMMGALSPGLKRHSVTLFEGESFAIAVACAVTSSKDRELHVNASASPDMPTIDRSVFICEGCLCALHTLHALLDGLREAHAKAFASLSLDVLHALPGGRVTGAEVIHELITELDASVEAAAGFEGEMQRLSGYARYSCSLSLCTPL